MTDQPLPKTVQASARQGHHGRGIGMAVLATLAYALVDTISKYLVRDYPVTMVVWARYTVPTLLLLAVFLPRRGRSLFRTRHPWLQLSRGLLLTAGTGFIVCAVQVMPLGEAQAISFIHPVLLTLMAVLFLGEKVGRLGWIAIAMGFAGVMIIIRPGGGLFTWAAILPLGLAVCYSSYQLLTRRIAGVENSINSMVFVMLFGALAMSATLPLSWVAPDGAGCLLLLAVGIVSGCGHFAMIKALEWAPASMLAPFAYIQLLWVSLLGMLVFNAWPDAITFVGIAIIVAAGLMMAVVRRRSG